MGNTVFPYPFYNPYTLFNPLLFKMYQLSTFMHNQMSFWAEMLEEVHFSNLFSHNERKMKT